MKESSLDKEKAPDGWRDEEVPEGLSMNEKSMNKNSPPVVQDQAISPIERELAKIADGSGPDFMSITEVPSDTEERRLVSQAMTSHLIGSLPPDWHPKNPESGDLLDDVIINEAVSLGWRVLLSDRVLQTIQQWHDSGKNGPALLARLFRAIEKSARVARGQSRHPMNSPGLYDTRKELLKELRRLSKRLHVQTNGLVRLPTKAGIRVMVRNEITAVPTPYPCLLQNETSFLRYLELQDDNQVSYPLTKRFASGDATPAEVLDGWTDWAFSTSEGQSRKRISRLRHL